MSSPANSTPRVSRAPFGTLPDGRAVDVFRLANAAGLILCTTPFGGAITSLLLPDREGQIADVVLSYAGLGDYADDRFFLGTLIGRFANRIARGRFSLDGRTFRLPINNGENHLHGGPAGFHKQLWDAEPFTEGGTAGLVLRRVSPDGEAGYPGTLKAEITYRWESPATLEVSYRATTDAPTPVSLTQHSYLNLAGEGDVLGHVLEIEADQFTPIDEGLIPTGGSAAVAGTPFDFRVARPIGRGYDLNFPLRAAEAGLRRAARVADPRSGRTLTVFTTEPALQLYTGNHLEKPFPRHGGLCLEPQRFPDAPNHPEFPSAILRPGQEYRSRTRMVFGVDGTR
jgi:aldose 1-epimerase